MRLSKAGADGGVVLPAESGLTDVEFDQLWLSTWSTLVRLAWLLLGDQAAAEDVVQDACISVYRRREQLTDLPGARAYLRTAVLNGARSTLRRRVVRIRMEDRFGSLEGIADRPHDRQDDYLMIVAAMMRLPRRQREVLVLRYWLGLSEAEIAEQLTVSAGTVKSTAARGLGRLREVLGVQDHE